MNAYITLDADESNALLRCLMRAAAVGRTAGNVGVVARAFEMADLIIKKWLERGDANA